MATLFTVLIVLISLVEVRVSISPIFTGNVTRDFGVLRDTKRTIQLSYPNNATRNNPFNDLQEIHLDYDTSEDTLRIGFKCSSSSCYFKSSGCENFGFLFYIPNRTDLWWIGVANVTELSSFGVYPVRSVDLNVFPSSLNVGSKIMSVVDYFLPPNASNGASDIEFSVNGFSQFPGWIVGGDVQIMILGYVGMRWKDNCTNAFLPRQDQLFSWRLPLNCSVLSEEYNDTSPLPHLYCYESNPSFPPDSNITNSSDIGNGYPGPPEFSCILQTSSMNFTLPCINNSISYISKDPSIIPIGANTITKTILTGLPCTIPIPCFGIRDDCGVCNGDNGAKDVCGVCFGNNSQLNHCGTCNGSSTEVCPGKVLKVVRIDFSWLFPADAMANISGLASIGDLNRDGSSDYAVGMPNLYGGAVFILFPDKNGNLTRWVNITGDLFKKDPAFDSTSMGYSVAPIGDMNGDNIMDIAVGAPFAFNGEGRVYLFFLSQHGYVIGYSILQDPTPHFGKIVTMFLLDSKNPVLLTPVELNSTKTNGTRVISPAVLVTVVRTGGGIVGKRMIMLDTVIGPVVSIDNIAVIGDWNKDSRDELTITVSKIDTTTGMLSSLVYFLFLKPDGSISNYLVFNQSSVNISSSTNNDNLCSWGCSICPLSDLNNNGIPDFILSDPAANQMGTLYVMSPSNNTISLLSEIRPFAGNMIERYPYHSKFGKVISSQNVGSTQITSFAIVSDLIGVIDQVVLNDVTYHDTSNEGENTTGPVPPGYFIDGPVSPYPGKPGPPTSNLNLDITPPPPISVIFPLNDQPDHIITPLSNSDLSMRIGFISIEELDSNLIVVDRVYLNQTWKVRTDVYPEKILKLYTFNPLVGPFSVKIEVRVIQYFNTTVISVVKGASKNVTEYHRFLVAQNSNKWSINIDGWNLKSYENKLRLKVSFVLSETVIESIQRDSPSERMSRFTFNTAHSQIRVSIPRFGVIDYFLEDFEDNWKYYMKEQYMDFIFPSFKKSMEFDPDFSILEQNYSTHGMLTFETGEIAAIIGGAIFGIICFVGLIVMIVYGIKRTIRIRQKEALWKDVSF